MPSKPQQRYEKKTREKKKKSGCQHSAPRREDLPDMTSPRTFQQMPQSYAQTAGTPISGRSEYQAVSVAGLPSARSWPSYATIPCQTRLDYDLLGIDRNLHIDEYSLCTTTAYPGQSMEFSHHQSRQPDNACGSSARGLGGLDRFIAEASSEQGAVYFRAGLFDRAREGYCDIGAWRDEIPLSVELGVEGKSAS